MIDLRYVKKLVELVESSSVDSIEISTEKGMKIRISKTPSRGAGAAVAAQMPAVMQPAVEPRLTPGTGLPAMTEPEAPPKPAAPPAEKYLEVKSPMVGTFYGAPEPGAKPYVSVGSRIQKGQILCIIEAMKIMNEIESDYAGVVKEVAVTDAHPVEYGQVLFRIDPNG